MKHTKMNKIIILPKQKDSNNECTVYIETAINEDGKRKRNRKSTGVKVNPKNWSKTKGKVLSGDNLHEVKNSDISTFFESLNKHFLPRLQRQKLKLEKLRKTP